MSVVYRVRPGGLMRCCTGSLAEAMDAADEAPKEGDVLHCRYCKNGEMIFRDGAWEWKR